MAKSTFFSLLGSEYVLMKCGQKQVLYLFHQAHKESLYRHKSFKFCLRISNSFFCAFQLPQFWFLLIAIRDTKPDERHLSKSKTVKKSISHRA